MQKSGNIFILSFFGVTKSDEREQPTTDNQRWLQQGYNHEWHLAPHLNVTCDGKSATNLLFIINFFKNAKKLSPILVYTGPCNHVKEKDKSRKVSHVLIYGPDCTYKITFKICKHKVTFVLKIYKIFLVKPA